MRSTLFEDAERENAVYIGRAPSNFQARVRVCFALPHSPPTGRPPAARSLSIVPTDHGSWKGRGRQSGLTWPQASKAATF